MKAVLSGKPNFFTNFQSSFGFPIFSLFSDSFSCKSFLFLSLIKACIVFLASLYSIYFVHTWLSFVKFSKQFVSGGYLFFNLSIKPLICIAFCYNSFCRCHFVYYIKNFWGYVRVSYIYTTIIFIIWKCQLTESFS